MIIVFSSEPVEIVGIVRDAVELKELIRKYPGKTLYYSSGFYSINPTGEYTDGSK